MSNIEDTCVRGQGVTEKCSKEDKQVYIRSPHEASVNIYVYDIEILNININHAASCLRELAFANCSQQIIDGINCYTGCNEWIIDGCLSS